MIFGKGIQRRQDSFHTEALPHLDALYNAATYLTRDTREAEDLVQETFLKAYRFWSRYKAGTNCKAWLFRILTNTHINRNRGRRRDLVYLDSVEGDGMADDASLGDASAFYRDPEADYLYGLVHDDVREAVEALPEDFRMPVVLVDLQDFSYKEVAEIMECPIGTVMSRLHRGRKLLQKKLRARAIEAGIIPATPEDAVEEAPPGAASLEAYRQNRQKRLTPRKD